MADEVSNIPSSQPPSPGSDPEFDALVARYRTRLSVIFVEIETATNAADLTALSILSHRLHGIAGGYGFVSIVAPAAALSFAIRDGKPLDEVRALATQLLAAIAVVK